MHVKGFYFVVQVNENVEKPGKRYLKTWKSLEIEEKKPGKTWIRDLANLRSPCNTSSILNSQIVELAIIDVGSPN